MEMFFTKLGQKINEILIYIDLEPKACCFRSILISDLSLRANRLHQDSWEKKKGTVNNTLVDSFHSLQQFTKHDQVAGCLYKPQSICKTQTIAYLPSFSNYASGILNVTHLAALGLTHSPAFDFFQGGCVVIHLT